MPQHARARTATGRPPTQHPDAWDAHCRQRVVGRIELLNAHPPVEHARKTARIGKRQSLEAGAGGTLAVTKLAASWREVHAAARVIDGDDSATVRVQKTTSQDPAWLLSLRSTYLPGCEDDRYDPYLREANAG